MSKHKISDDLLIQAGSIDGLNSPVWVIGIARYGETGERIAVDYLQKALEWGWSPSPFPIDIDRLKSIAEKGHKGDGPLTDQEEALRKMMLDQFRNS